MSTNTYVALATTTVTGSVASSVTLSPVPSGYTDLVLVASAQRGISGSGGAGLTVTFNGDSGSNYSSTLLYEGSPYSTRLSNSANLGYVGSAGDGNFELNTIHIMNYGNSTTYKTAICRYGSTADAQARAAVGTWRNTAAITSITMTPPNGFAVGSTFTLYGVANADTGAYASGGIITYDANYYYHTFAANGTFTPNRSLTADILAVAGGGGGGDPRGGGGGAGGVLLLSSQSLTATGYSVTIGAGGTVASGNRGTNGTDSYSGALTHAVGGGGGGGDTNSPGSSGGSGGGAFSAGTAGTNTSGQGNAGGTGLAYVGGGGGGAGAVGQNAVSSSQAGNGGVGTSTYNSWSAVTSVGQNISGTYYLGGGGGGGQNSSGTAGTGGYGGGGTGQVGNGTVATAGTPNTGGGGGAGGGVSGSTYGTPAAGGSGVVIVRYAK